MIGTPVATERTASLTPIGAVGCAAVAAMTGFSGATAKSRSKSEPSEIAAGLAGVDAGTDAPAPFSGATLKSVKKSSDAMGSPPKYACLPMTAVGFPCAQLGIWRPIAT